MATPNKSEPIRCGMCGKLNSADRAMCEYCGARLRPMTPEELGLTPSEPKDSGEGLPQTPGATDTLHMRFEEVEEDTVIGPSAAKAQREREQAAEEEPDFTFGGREEAPSGDVPDWLREASKPADEPEAAGGVPDWLAQEAETEAPSPIEIPDWLGADSATQPPAPRASEEDMPDWLRAADERDREEPAQADWLSDTARSESTQPMPRADETPDWLRDISQPAAESSEPSGEAPDWLTEMKEERQEATPDWLRAPEDTDHEEPPPPSAPPPPKRSGVTDWLRGLGVEPTAEEIKAALPPTPEPPPSEQPPAEPPQAKPVRPISSIPLDETPDWLLALESQTPEETPEALSEQPPVAQETTPVEPEESPGSTEPGVPDWLRGEESQAPPSAAEWLSELSGEGAPAASQPEETPGEAPDWLRAPEDQTPVEMSQAEAPSAPTDMPDWLSGMGAESAAPAEAPESEVSGTGAEGMEPDWLRAPDEEAPVTPPEAPAQAESPDWLSGMGAEAAEAPDEPEHELPPLASMGSMPDWLRAPEETPAETPQAEAPPAPVEMPDWLTGMGAETASPAEAEAGPSDSEEAEPDWLRAPEETPVEMPRAEAPPAPGDVPDWLSGMAAEPSAPAEIAVADTETGLPEGLGEAPAPVEPAVDVPDWLRDAGTGPAAPSEGAEPPIEPATPAGEVEAPDWLSDLGGAPTAPPESAPEASAAEQPVEAPDWLGNLAAPSTPEPQTLEAAAPSGEVEAPDWLSDLGAGQPAAPPAAEPAGDMEAPDWLSDLGAAPESPSEMPVPADTATPLGDEEAPDWLNMMDLELGDTGLGKPSGGEDLLGLSEDLLTPEEVREEEEAELTSADLPEWLREAAPGEKPPTGPAPLTPSKDLPPELAAELEGLRFEAVTGERGDEKITEKVGALKDVTGVIRPELLFDGASLHADELIDQVIITNDQARRVQAVQSMLDREAEGVYVSGQRQSVVPIVRWLIVLVLIAAVAAVRFTRLLPEPSVDAAPNDAHQFIADLPADSTVVVAFEYEPDTAAEMQPLAEALLSDLAQRNDITVLALSTRPTGAAMAQSAMAALERTPSSWANVGYISGGPTGISALTNGVLPGFGSPLQIDYRGKTLNTEVTRLSDLKPGLIIVLAARSEYLRAWIEQAGSPLQTPVIAAVSAGVSPLAYPYQQSGQLVAVLSGINDAVAYNALEGGSGESEVVTTWNAQGVGGAAAAVLILIGGVFYGLRALRQQQEQV